MKALSWEWWGNYDISANTSRPFMIVKSPRYGGKIAEVWRNSSGWCVSTTPKHRIWTGMEIKEARQILFELLAERMAERFAGVDR